MCGPAGGRFVDGGQAREVGAGDGDGAAGVAGAAVRVWSRTERHFIQGGVLDMW